MFRNEAVISSASLDGLTVHGDRVIEKEFDAHGGKPGGDGPRVPNWGDSSARKNGAPSMRMPAMTWSRCQSMTALKVDGGARVGNGEHGGDLRERF